MRAPVNTTAPLDLRASSCYREAMRLIPIIMLALLMVGFAARPSVSAALTNGSVLTHPFAAVIVVAEHPTLDAPSDGEGALSFQKCASLGILPMSLPCMERQRHLLPAVATDAVRPAGRIYWILRPPIPSVQAKQLAS